MYEYFEKDNNLYLVQEFIDGMSLSEEFEQQGAFDGQKIQTILEELLPILVYIEEKNLLHRDIKPANIMRRSSDGVLMLIDFGAARVKTGRDPSVLTAIYSPGYAAIEHIMGRPVKASDIYSLGITCIRLLTGCFPSDARDMIYDDQENCLCWKEYVEERNIKVSERLVAILDKMVASSLRIRYHDAQAVLKDLLFPISPVPSLPKVVETGHNSTVPQTFFGQLLSLVQSSKRFGLLASVLAILTGVVGIKGYLSDNNNAFLKSLETLESQYQQGKYQDCYQSAIDNLNQDNSVIQEWISKCGLEVAKINANASNYSDAIIIAQTIPSTVANYQQVKDNINNWSEKILEYATEVYKQGKLEDAIKVTNIIPKNTIVKAKLPKLISQWQQEELRHKTIINNAQNLSKQTEWDAAKKEVGKIPNDFVFWRKKAQLILNKANANQKINAQGLRELLEEKKWKEADKKTARLMLQVAERETEGWLRREDINKFSCEYLRIIDQFWLESSQRKFGFSVQQEIWQKNGSPNESSEDKNVKDWRNFFIDVGWKTDDSGIESSSGYVKYENLIGFRDLTTSRRGNLPATLNLVQDKLDIYFIVQRTLGCGP